MVKTELYIPKYFYSNIFDINYNMLKERGIKALFFDLDNTLIDYNTEVLPVNVVSLLTKLEKDFKIVIVSNNSKKRVSKALKNLFPFVSRALKPLKRGFKKAKRIVNFNYNEICVIGDQLMTDIKGSNKLAMCNILILPILVSTDAWTTKINRYFENKVIRKIKNKHYDIYEKKVEVYDKHRNNL